MKRFCKKITSAILVFFFISIAAPSPGQHSDESTRINNLRSAIDKILKDTNTPAAGIALVHKNKNLWVGGLGKSDLQNNTAANENTLFRIASISKMFVALSILKLQEEGRLTLQDKIRDLVPEIEYSNRWEESNPVRIVHLLEHTTGWDEYHLIEQVESQITLKEGLDYHPHSRTSRWVPGTRMAYTNSGSAVAAYIVEKITGQLYEDYVKENFFVPLKMQNTTFFNDDPYKKYGATLYDGDLQPIPYRHVIQRPAGSINSSASEMGNFIRFLLNRGTLDSAQILSDSSIVRMESPKSTPGYQAGLQLGYGLANATSIHKGFIYQGHNGAVPGALSELAYLPEQGVGHAIFINAMNPDAFQRISTLIKDFETETLNLNPPAEPSYSGNLNFPTGYYVSINPRIGPNYFLDRLFDIYRFDRKENFLVKSWIVPGGKTVFYPVTDSTFRMSKSDKIALVKSRDPIAGEVLHTDTRVLKPISAIAVFGQLVLLGMWIVLAFIGFLLCILAYLRYWILGHKVSLKIRTFPAIASICFVSATLLLMVGHEKYNSSLVRPGLLSISLMVMSIMFVLAAVGSVGVVIKSRKKKISTVTFFHMALMSFLHVLVALYLISFGVIPLMTWV